MRQRPLTLNKFLIAVLALLLSASLVIFPVYAAVAEPLSGSGNAGPSMSDFKGTYDGVLIADGEKIASANGDTIISDEADVSALLAENGGELTVKDADVAKSGDSEDSENSGNYGVNSIGLAAGIDSVIKISASDLTSDGAGANALFATDNASVWAYDDRIATSADSSAGLDATYGGSVIADTMTISTKGDHSAAIAACRGGGNVSVTNSTIGTSGQDSPLIYSAGTVEADNVTGAASDSRIAAVEGAGAVKIFNSSMESKSAVSDESGPAANGILIYGSGSGDDGTSDGGSAVFQVTDSKLTSAVESGALFCVTDTKANVLLRNSSLEFDSDSAGLMLIAGDPGESGSDGADVTLTLSKQTAAGDIEVDSLSSLKMYITEASVYSGSVKEWSGDTYDGIPEISVFVGGDSTWTLSGSVYLTDLSMEPGAVIKGSDGKTASVSVDGETVVTGDSSDTVYVDGEYSDSFTLTDASDFTGGIIDRTAFDAEFGTRTVISLSAAPLSALTPSVTAEADEDASMISGGSGSFSFIKEYKNELIIGLVGIAALLLIITIIGSRRRKKAK